MLLTLILFSLAWLTSAKTDLNFISFGNLPRLQTELLNDSSHNNAYSAKKNAYTANTVILLTVRQKLRMDAENN
jgi:hypothetical protein